MTNMRVIFKPGGVVALLVLSAATVTAGVMGFRRHAPSTAPTVVGAAPAPKKFLVDPNMSTGEIQDKELLVRLNETPAQVRKWLILGPILAGSAITEVANNADDEAKMRKIIATSYLPTEAKYQARENVPVTIGKVAYHWRKETGSAFDFMQMYVSPETPFSVLNNRVVYAYTTIDSKVAAQKELHFRSDDGAIVWINGQQVYLGNKIRGVDTEDIVPIALRAGHNNVLVKVGQGSGGWGMSFQLEDVSGKTKL